MNLDDSTTSSDASGAVARASAVEAKKRLAAINCIALSDCSSSSSDDEDSGSCDSSSDLSGWGDSSSSNEKCKPKKKCTTAAGGAKKAKDAENSKDDEDEEKWPDMESEGSDSEEVEKPVSPQPAAPAVTQPAVPAPAPAPTTTTPVAPVEIKGETSVTVAPAVVLDDDGGGIARVIQVPSASQMIAIEQHALEFPAEVPRTRRTGAGVRWKMSTSADVPRSLPKLPLLKSTAESTKIAVSVMKQHAKNGDVGALKKACANSGMLLRLRKAFSGLHRYANKAAEARAPVYEDEFFMAKSADLDAAKVRDIEWAHTNLKSAMHEIGFPVPGAGLSSLARTGDYYDEDNYQGAEPVTGAGGAGVDTARGRAAVAMEAHANAYVAAAVAEYRQMPEMESRAINELDRANGDLFQLVVESGRVERDKLKQIADAFDEHNQDALEEISAALQGVRRVRQAAVDDYYMQPAGKMSDDLNTGELLPALTVLYNGDQQDARKDWQRHLDLEAELLAELKRSGESEAFLAVRRRYVEQAFAMGTRIDLSSEAYLRRRVVLDDTMLYPEEDSEPVRGPDCEPVRESKACNDGNVIEKHIHHYHHHYVLCKPEEYCDDDEQPPAEEPVYETFDPACPPQMCSSMIEFGHFKRSQFAGLAMAAFAAAGDYFGPDDGDDEAFDPTPLRNDLAEFVASQVNAPSATRRGVAQALIANVVSQVQGGSPDNIHKLATLISNIFVTEARSLKCARQADLIPLLQRMADDMESLADAVGSAPSLSLAARSSLLARIEKVSGTFKARFASAGDSIGARGTPNANSGVAQDLAASLVEEVQANAANKSRAGKYVYIERQAPYFVQDTIRFPEALADVLFGMLTGVKVALGLLDATERALVMDEWKASAQQIRAYANEVIGSGDVELPAPEPRPTRQPPANPAQPQPQPGRTPPGRSTPGAGTTTTTTTTVTTPTLTPPITTTTTTRPTVTVPGVTTTTPAIVVRSQKKLSSRAARFDVLDSDDDDEDDIVLRR